MKIAGVVVAYNPTENINDCIESYIHKVEKLYVVDNSSNDNSDIIKKNKKIEYISEHKNVGIAEALNIAARKALQEGYDYLLTMDQDSKFEGDNLEILLDFASTCDKNTVGLISPWHITKEEKTMSEDDIEEVVEVMTSGNVVNLKIWEKIGGWRSDFFIDNVDIEYCMHLNKEGYKVLRYNKAKLIHNLGNMTKAKMLWKTITCTNHNYLRQYYMIRNLYYLADLYGNDFPENIKKMKRGARGRFRYILFGEKDKYRKIRNMFRGYIDYKKGITGEYKYKN